MPEDENKEEQTQETQETKETPQSNGAATTEDIEAIKAQLEEERQAKAAAEAALAELQNQLSEAKQASEAAAAEKTSLSDALTTAVSKYLQAVKLANPAIPGDVITGSTIDEIDASLAKATTIAESVKKSLESQAKEARVPAGAPPRTEINIEGLSPREKIAVGITQKQGGI
jgi:chromosome segregation ATPase